MLLTATGTKMVVSRIGKDITHLSSNMIFILCVPVTLNNWSVFSEFYHITVKFTFDLLDIKLLHVIILSCWVRFCHTYQPAISEILWMDGQHENVATAIINTDT